MIEDIKKYAVVVDNTIVNVILWDSVSKYESEGELTLIDGLEPEPGIGWIFKNKKWVNPVPVEPAKDAK